MEPQVAFYRLTRKIVNDREAVPEEARQVMYYSLAIGHHVGVMDCFSELLAVPEQQFRAYVERLPAGEARRKLQGVLAWHEIEINRGHVDELMPVLKASLAEPGASQAQWMGTFIACLQEMVAEPALYLMLKLRA